MSAIVPNIRVAIIIPVMGPGFPIWFPLFAASCGHNMNLIDWLIFSSEENIQNVKNIQLPRNIRLLPCSLEQLASRVFHLLHTEGGENHSVSNLQRFIELFTTYPYLLVELKPMLGSLFEEYLHQYTHWGYGDVDVLLGDLTSVLTINILQSFEVITFTFGDHNSLYLRAQLTFFQKRSATLLLWKKCRHLNDLFLRILQFSNRYGLSEFTQRDNSRVPRGWIFQSAEGCVSKIAIDYLNLSVLFLPLQFSDQFLDGKLESKGILIHNGSFFRCSKNFSLGGLFLGTLPNFMQFLSDDNTQVAVQQLSRNCSFWIDPQYSVNIT
jgi:hypothetical protein